MDTKYLSLSIPYVRNIKIFEHNDHFIAKTLNFIDKKSQFLVVIGLTKSIFHRLSYLPLATLNRFFSINEARLQLIYHPGLVGGGCCNSKNNLESLPGNSKNSPESQQSIFGSSASKEKNSIDTYTPEQLQTLATKYKKMPLNKFTNEQLQLLINTQAKVFDLASKISEQMKGGTIDNSFEDFCFDDLLKINPYECEIPYAISEKLLENFNCDAF